MNRASDDLPRFLVDAMLGNVARDLRLLGYDAEFRPELPDPALLRLAQREGRVLVTRDRGLVRRARNVRCVWVAATSPAEQTREVLAALPPHPAPPAWSRCLVCNGVLRPAPDDAALAKVPDHIALRHRRSLIACDRCGRVYWPGSHAARLAERLRRLRGAALQVAGGSV
ncbi:Mut7-C RNAse domain-containing protein [Deferrisoma sp.]